MDELWAKHAGALIGVAGALIAALIGAAAVIYVARKQRRTTPAEDIARALAEAHLDRFADVEAQLRDQDTEIAALTGAVEALQAVRGIADAPAGIHEALTRLVAGDTAKAEEIFRRVLEGRRAEGTDALKEAAAAARHLGALAFLHDTDAALRAYSEAVELDPDNADGWNQLGRLRYRTGDLDGAADAYERVLRLGNAVDDKTIIAVAYGNLGLIYETRGDLDAAEEHISKSLVLNEGLGRKEEIAIDYGDLGVIHQTRGDLDAAEEYFRNSLALSEELGRKEGMASQYGNLGQVFRERGDLAEACRLWAEAKRLFEELGAAPQVAQVQGRMDEHGCGGDAE